MNKILVSLLNATSYWRESTDEIGEIVKRLAVKTSLHKVYNNQIQTPPELFNYCSSNIHNITFFCVQEEQIFNKNKEIAERFDIAVALLGIQAYHCLKLLNSTEITTAVTLLSTSFTTHLIKYLKSNSTDILVSQMIISSYIAYELVVTDSWVLFKKDKT
jgi:hypothetical protein